MMLFKDFYQTIINRNKTKKKGVKGTVFTGYSLSLQQVIKATTLYKWQGAPKELDVKELELTLFEHGQAFVFKDDLIGLIALPCSVKTYSEQGTPTELYVNGKYNMHEIMKASDGVLVYANNLRVATKMLINDPLIKVTNIDRTIDVMVTNSSAPLIARLPRKMKATIDEILRQRDEHEPVIYVEDTFNPNEKMEQLTPNYNPNIEAMLDLRKLYIKELNECSGIRDTQTEDKQERLLTAEINTANSATNIYAENGLNCRQDACKLINEKFGTEISVDYSINYKEVEMYEQVQS